MVDKEQTKVTMAIKDIKKMMKKGGPSANVPYLPLSPEPKSALNL